jgi:hypothetical protein
MGKCIFYSQLRDLTIFFINQDQNFSKIYKADEKNVLAKTKKLLVLY